MKTKTPKPRVMWANYYPTMRDPVVHASKNSAEVGAAGLGKTLRVAVIPLDDMQGIMDRMAEAFSGSYDGHLHCDDLRAMLKAIGIPCKQRRAGK